MKKIVFSICFFLLAVFFNVYAEDNFNDFIIDLDSKNYYLSVYYDTLKEENRNELLNYFPKNIIFNDTVWEEVDGGIIHKWYEENFFPLDNITLVKTLENKVSNNRLCIGKCIIIDIKSLYKENTKTKLTFSERHYGEEEDWYFWTLLDWKILRKTNSNTLVFIEDGDYLNIFYDKDKLIPFATFAKMNDETLEQFKSLIYTNKCDLSKVTWPRHADGSCDYEKRNTLVASSSSATNVSINKTMSVKENLKLRSAEATTSTVLNVMAVGTKVKILELGKAEIIDGINSNWVKVEVQKGAKDRDGKEIKSGTTGWCYGGYLE